MINIWDKSGKKSNDNWDILTWGMCVFIPTNRQRNKLRRFLWELNKYLYYICLFRNAMKSRTPKSTGLLCSTAPYLFVYGCIAFRYWSFLFNPKWVSGLPHQLDDTYIDATCSIHAWQLLIYRCYNYICSFLKIFSYHF